MEKHISSNKRVYFGVFLIILGGLWILGELNLIDKKISDILISWQMLLFGIGIFSFLLGNRTTGTVLMLIGLIGMSFMFSEFETIHKELEKIGFQLLIVGLGILLLVTHARKKHSPQINGSVKQGIDFFDDFVIFGGREVFVNSMNFYGGKSTSIFGGTEYDLRQSNLSENGAAIDCVAIFGACGFKVPPDWTVKNEVTSIFGAFSDKRGSTLNQLIPDPSKTLVIKGFSAFGGVEVKLF